MNRTKLKSYAPQARRDFIAAVTNRAAHYGMTKGNIEPITEQGEVSLIGGTPFPRHVAAKRKRLEERINRQGFEQVMEAVAYTWFNRLVAIRYMELHGYLDHGYRVLSHPEGKTTPEIIEHAEHVDLPGLDTQKVIDLKLDGTKEAELYRMLLVAQCNALHRAMPFLFERINDETELLLPDNLLHSDSLIRKLVNAIDDEDWQEVEIIGWLYQFYISEKKDEVIGKVVKSEDIPAATQLFTPHWIVKYLVQNSLGRQWMATYPDSRLKEQMEFYIEPAEQTPEVQAQIKEITPDSLNPEELTLLDPACGSGHILVEAYDLLKAIYQERGYRGRDIPRLILEKNLYGLEIDDRAAQLAAFALLMKAREDDRRIFSTGAQPNVLAIQTSNGLDAVQITEDLNTPLTPLSLGVEQGENSDVSQNEVANVLDLFADADVFGSLLVVPKNLSKKIQSLTEQTKSVLESGDLVVRHSAWRLLQILKQAQLLATKYLIVVTNPPYLDSSNMPPILKRFIHSEYAEARGDTFSAFIVRSADFTLDNGYLGFVTPFVWMFLKKYKDFRKAILENYTLNSLIQLEYNAFEPACVPVCTFTLSNCVMDHYTGSFIKLSNFKGIDNQAPRALEAIHTPSCEWRYSASASSFKTIPGSPFAYWICDKVLDVFRFATPLRALAEPKQGLATGDNDRFLRLWSEVDVQRVSFNCPTRDAAQQSGRRWFPCNKGGPFRKWYGNNLFLVNWENDGEELRRFTDDKGRLRSRPQNINYYFKKGITWTTLSSSAASFRLSPVGHIFETKGSTCFAKKDSQLDYLLGFLNSSVVNYLLGIFSPTLDFHEGPIASLPVVTEQFRISKEVSEIVQEAVDIARKDWNSLEMSWDFQQHYLLSPAFRSITVEHSYKNWMNECHRRVMRLKELEESNNQIFLRLYGLEDELSASIDEDDIILLRPLREEAIKGLVSYSVGCMMGRYSLDRPGLIYAHCRNERFDPSEYRKFPADEDGIVPVMDFEWFEDDAANRIEKFFATAWSKEYLEENLRFVAETLGPKRGEQCRDTIRRYLSQEFFKNHLQDYKGPKHPPRPIYWLFSSGKQRAFQCLVYLHRYNEGTLSRMRTEYVIPLQGKIASRIGQLDDDIAAAMSTSHRKRLEKERDKLLKQQVELQTFDEKLRHYADRRIRLDLDDGVKVNYAKFGDLLAEVKAVTGSTQET